MSYLMIENKNEIDISALILLGASTKRDDDTKIGFFGSGNKYAISSLLRLGIKFHIFSGDREVSISTESLEFREKSFNRILVNGQQTSLTTDMGPQWEPWMAIREWVSNSLDEGAHNVVVDTDNVQGRNGYTRFFVEHCAPLEEMIDSWNRYFTFDRSDSLVSNKDGKVFPQTDPNSNLILYRKGIRVYFDTNIKSIYEYDVNNISINESRLIESMSDAQYRTAKFLSMNATVSVAKNIFQRAFNEGTWESLLPWRWGVSELSSVWREAIGDRVLIVDNVSGYFIDIQQRKPFYIVNIEMAQRIKRSFPDVPIYGMSDSGIEFAHKPAVMTPKTEFLLKEVMKFFEETGYEIGYNVEVVEFSESEVWGKAENGKILLSKTVFDKGKKEIALTLIEENEHLKSGLKDCTRSFQNHIFNLFLTEKEERFGYFL